MNKDIQNAINATEQSIIPNSFVINSIGNAFKQIQSKLQNAKINPGNTNQEQQPPIQGPQDHYNPDPNAINTKLDGIIKNTGLNLSPQDKETFRQGLTSKILNNFGQIKNNLENKTGYTQLKNESIKQTENYFKTISQLPGYAQIKKKYMSEVSNDDLDYAVKELSKNRDSAYSMIMAQAYKRGDNINPYEIQQQADQLGSMYDSQINELIKKKQDRIDNAKDLAKLDYEDMMNKLKLSQDMLDRLNNMKQEAYKQVIDGTADEKWIAELDNTINRTNRDYKLRQKEVRNNTGINNARLLLNLKEYEKKYGESIDPTQRKYYFEKLTNERTNLLRNTINGQENPDKVVKNLQQNSLGYNTFTNTNGIVNIADQSGVNEILGKKGGSVSWRNNNPGNILFSSPEVAKWLGAVGIYTNYNKTDKNGQPYQYLMFGNPQQGAQAIEKLLLYGKSYQGKPLAERLKTFQGGSSVAVNILKQEAPQLLSKTGNFTSEEMQLVANAIQKGEGWQEGNNIDYPEQKDNISGLQNEITTMAQVYKDRGLSVSQANTFLKQQFNSPEAKAIIAEQIPLLFRETTEELHQDKFKQIYTKITGGTYINKDGTLNNKSLINDVMQSGIYKKAQDPIKAFSTNLIEKATPTEIGGLLPIIASLKPGLVIVKPLQDKGLSNTDIATLYINNIVKNAVNKDGEFDPQLAVDEYIKPLQQKLGISKEEMRKIIDENLGTTGDWFWGITSKGEKILDLYK